MNDDNYKNNRDEEGKRNTNNGETKRKKNKQHIFNNNLNIAVLKTKHNFFKKKFPHCTHKIRKNQNGMDIFGLNKKLRIGRGNVRNTHKCFFKKKPLFPCQILSKTRNNRFVLIVLLTPT